MTDGKLPRSVKYFFSLRIAYYKAKTNMADFWFFVTRAQTLLRNCISFCMVFFLTTQVNFGRILHILDSTKGKRKLNIL